METTGPVCLFRGDAGMIDPLMKAAALVEDRYRAIPREVLDAHQGV